MQSYLIIASDKTLREEHAHTICQDMQIDQFDITFIEKDQNLNKDSLGIATIHSFLTTIALKPLRGTKKALIIKDAHSMTHEAQNALLKTLEEPPPETFIFLTAETVHAFLPTILSRCTVVMLAGQERVVDREKCAADVKLLTEQPLIIPALFAKEKETEKEKATRWLEDMQLFLREELFSGKNVSKNYLLLQKLHTAYKQIKTTNINVRFLLETTFLSDEEETEEAGANDTSHT